MYHILERKKEKEEERRKKMKMWEEVEYICEEAY
jgi:hypothetical protein